MQSAGTSSRTAPIDSGSFHAGMTSAATVMRSIYCLPRPGVRKLCNTPTTAMARSGVIRRFPTAAAAREALLVGRGRLAVDPGALPAAVRSTIQATFGADLGAEEVVRRVLEDV